MKIFSKEITGTNYLGDFFFVQQLNFVHKGMTPLMVACHEGQQEVAKALLELGAEINRVENGSTALMAALEG